MNRQLKSSSGPGVATLGPAVAAVAGTGPRELSAQKKGSKRPPAPEPGLFDRALDWLINFFSSLRLTVVCLGIGIVLVFAGTIAQVDLGLLKAQNEYFRSLAIYWGPKTASWKIPVFPGGYLVGGVLLLNLISAHVKRFKFTSGKIGIWMVHFGLILLLLGQLLTDLLARESFVHLREGETRNYSESDRQAELAVIDKSDPDSDKVVAIPQGLLVPGKEIQHSDLPFTIRVQKFFANSDIQERGPDASGPAPATQGMGAAAVIKELPRVTETDKRDLPATVIEIAGPQGSLGTWLVGEVLKAQQLQFNNRKYELSMRLRRYYKPFSLQLLQFRHDVYLGTDIPKNFSSRVLLQRPDTGENREVLIYMNSPLRYAGETFYQASFDLDDHGTILQVVHNPSWLTPYFSCVLVGVGLVVQFATHLLGFTFKRRTA